MSKPTEIKFDEYYIHYKTQGKTYYLRKKSANLINKEYHLNDDECWVNWEQDSLSDLIKSVSTSGD